MKTKTNQTPVNTTLNKRKKRSNQPTRGAVEFADARDVESCPELLPNVRGQPVAHTRANQVRAHSGIVCTQEFEKTIQTAIAVDSKTGSKTRYNESGGLQEGMATKRSREQKNNDKINSNAKHANTTIDHIGK